MNQQVIVNMAQDALQLTLMVCGPMLAVSLVIGIFVSIAQVVTSIQDMTLSFVPRVIAVLLAFLFLFPWMMKLMLGFTAQLFGQLGRFAH